MLSDEDAAAEPGIVAHAVGRQSRKRSPPSRSSELGVEGLGGLTRRQGRNLIHIVQSRRKGVHHRRAVAASALVGVDDDAFVETRSQRPLLM